MAIKKQQQQQKPDFNCAHSQAQTNYLTLFTIIWYIQHVQIHIHACQ